MRYIVLVLIIGLFVLTCKNRRDRIPNLNSQTHSAESYFKSYAATYVPSKAIEIKTDSLIENTFKVSIRNFSVDNNPIVVKSDDLTTYNSKKTTIHRRFESEIQVLHDTKTLLNEKLSLDLFKENSSIAFWKDATFEHVWVDQQKSNSELVSIHISIKNPKEKTYRLYEMRLDKYGQQSIALIEKSV